MSIILNDNIKVNAPKPVESKYFDGLNPWGSEAEAYAGIAPTERHIGLTINIGNEEWRWKDGVADADLVLKELGGGGDEENWSAKFQVTADFEEDEIIDLTTGIGSIGGTCNLFGDNIDGVDRVLGTSGGAFFSDNAITVYVSGQGQVYKSVAVLFDSPTSFHFPVPLEVGDYFWVVYDAGMGTTSQGFASAEDVTYAEAQALVNGGSLVPGSWYKLIDFYSKNNAGEQSIYSSPNIEPLFLQATSENSFAQRVYSETHFNDVINYNFGDNLITYYSDGGWDGSGGDWGADTTISNVTPTSFEINKEYDFNSRYYIDVEDSTNRYEFDNNGYGTQFTSTDIGGGQYRIDILSGPLDLTDGGGYIEIEGSSSIGHRRGNIIFRREEDSDIEASFDFRAHGTKRWKIDASLYSAYDSGASYSYRDIVLYLGHLYIAMGETTGETPAQNSKIWICIIYNYDKSYAVGGSYIYSGGVTIPRDDASGKVFDTIGKYDSGLEDTTPDLNGIVGLSAYSEDIVVHTDGTDGSISGLKIGENCDDITILGKCRDFTILENSRSMLVNLYAQAIQNVSLGTLNNIIFTNYISQNILYPISSGIINNTTYCTLSSGMSIFMVANGYTSSIGKQASNFRIGRMYKSNFGNGCVNSYIRNSREDSIGSVTNVYSYTDYFEFNTFGIYMQNVKIYSGKRFDGNDFLSYFGGQNFSSTLDVTYNFRFNNGGRLVFYSGASTASSFQYCTMHNSVRNLMFSGSVSYSEFGLRCNEIYGTGLNYSSFDKNANNITFRYGNYLNIGKNCSSISWGTGGDARAVRIEDGVQSITFGAIALSHSSGFYNKTITSGESNTKRMVYRKSTGTEQNIDPTL